MALLDGFMPGESYGMPTGSQNKWQGLLSDPMLQIGLGILANNNTRNTGQVLGRGALQGLGNVQQYQQQQQQQKQYELQMKKQQAELEQQAEVQKAVEEASKLHPELAPLFKLDHKAAIKTLYPQTAQADAYYQAIPTPQGLAKFNARTGELELIKGADGGAVMKSSDSPELQGQIAGAKSYGTNLYKPTDMMDGTIMPQSNLAIQSGAPPVNLQGGNALPQMQPQQQPQQPMFNGQPFPRVSPEEQAARDEKARQLIAAEGGNGGMGVRSLTPSLGGVRVPTKAQQEGMKEQAKANIELSMKPRIESAVDQAKANVVLGTDKTKNIRKADQFLSVAEQAKKILNDSENSPTASGVGAALDAAGNLIGVAPKGANEAARLATLSGWLVSNVPRMEGPQSNFDVENYKTMAGMIGDKTKPISTRQEALNEVIKLQEKYKALNQEGGNTNKASNVFDTMPKPNQYRGKIIRDDTTGKRYKSDGMQWKEVK